MWTLSVFVFIVLMLPVVALERRLESDSICDRCSHVLCNSCKPLVGAINSYVVGFNLSLTRYYR